MIILIYLILTAKIVFGCMIPDKKDLLCLVYRMVNMNMSASAIEIGIPATIMRGVSRDSNWAAMIS